MLKKILIFMTILLFSGISLTAVMAEGANEENNEPENADNPDNPDNPSYLKAVINVEKNVEVQKSTIFDASDSYIPNPQNEIKYSWDFGDGNKNEGIEVIHAYKTQGTYTITLKIDDGENTSEVNMEVFVYSKLIVLLTDETEVKERIENIKSSAAEKGAYIEIIESYGSSTEFISEEILTKKLTEKTLTLQKANQIVIWTKENAGLNSLSRYIKSNENPLSGDFSQKTITVLTPNVNSNINRIQRQFEVINPKRIIITKEGSIYTLIESLDDETFIQTLEKEGQIYKVIDEQTGKLRPWNFMSYFVNLLINTGVPDNTIALLLLLPVIATVVAFMRQIVGITTFGIYTPSIITLSFLIIGIYAGLLTLGTAILIGALMRPILKKVRMLFIPKMALVITLVSLILFLIIIASTYLNLFDAQFLSIAIFPMLILSTLVEKFVSVKTEKGLSSSFVLMISTVIVAVVAYLVAGGEINIGVVTFKIEAVKNIILAYPEIVILLIIINIILGKWSGLRILERIRFREVLRHIEE